MSFVLRAEPISERNLVKELVLDEVELVEEELEVELVVELESESESELLVFPSRLVKES